MKISEILTPDPEVILPDESILEAAKKMRDRDCGMIPVCDGKKLIGSITDRDLAIRAVAENRPADQTRVRDIMTSGIAYAFDDDDVQRAAEIMEERQIRRLPIVNREKRLVGIVSLGDVAVRSHENGLAEEALEGVSKQTR